MAKTKKPKEQPAPEPVKPSEVMKMPSGRVLKSLISSGAKADEQIAEIRGGYGAEVKKGTENQNVHKGALAWLRKLSKMSTSRAAEQLLHFEHGLEVIGLREKLDAQLKLFADSEGAGEDGEDGESASEGDDANVTRFPAAG